jgi:hypothetical protein
LAEVDLVGMGKSKKVKALELCHLDNLGSVSDYRADHAVDFEIHHFDLGVASLASFTGVSSIGALAALP